ncbi:hypothetical protein [Methylomonas methanica]|uniref:Uncharacterized protein n=1 Tax=Methylomonas methanica (strain DSM 25384 / MC09) TaxID=857087 RepID=F9ZZ98_METMM|nr:hypothetical protein [Methylomonas methanica]AEG01124.1 hypothetical protein Metme_2741 [Methylomonas methanica MC09]
MIEFDRIKHRLHILFKIAFLIGVIGLPARVSATPLFSASAGAGQNNDSQTNNSGVTAGASYNREREWGIEQSAGLAYADTGRMGAFGSASVQPQLYEYDQGLFGYGRLTSSGGGSALIRFDDIVFSGAVNGASSALVSTNIFIEGILNASGSSFGRGLSSANVSVSYGLGVPGPGSTAVLQTIGTDSYGYNNGTFSSSTSGIFSVLQPTEAQGFSRFFESPTFEVPLNTPVSLGIQLAASASVSTQDGGNMSALADFSHSLILGHGEPVFVLPDGVTANSVGAGIVNNRIPSQLTVPIPPAGGLLASALTALISLSASRRKMT